MVAGAYVSPSPPYGRASCRKRPDEPQVDVTVLLGLDLGTTGARAVAVDESGRLLASASAGYDLSMPRPGWTEQDPALWWQASRRVLTEVAAACEGEAAGLGLTGQMH